MKLEITIPEWISLLAYSGILAIVLTWILAHTYRLIQKAGLYKAQKQAQEIENEINKGE